MTGQPDAAEPRPRRRLVLVEDEPALAENYALAFARAGFEVERHAAAAPALEAIEARAPDAVIVDVGLGDEGDAGFELCRALRARDPRLPIVFLTARDAEIDVVSGLRLGADDYLGKDIGLAELVARVQTLLRRVETLSRASEDGARQRVGALLVDHERLEASWRERPLPLTVGEFRLVAALVRRPGQVLDRERLMRAAGRVLDEQTVTAQIKRIRRKFLAVDADFDAIETVYGLGYRWRERRGGG